MAIDYEAITQLARSYAKDVKNVLPVTKAMLYGSHAKGNATEHSDIDVCFFLEDYDDEKHMDILKTLHRLTRKYEKMFIEPVAFEASDLYTGNPFVNEVLKTGVDIL